MNSPKIFAGTASASLAKPIAQRAKIHLGHIEISRFADGETDVWIKEPVNNTNVFIVQSTSPPVNDHLIVLALIADALKRAGAHKITAVIPYFGYARKERQSRAGEPVSAKVAADIIVASGVNKIICVDLHSEAIVGFFNVPVIHLSALKLLAKAIKNQNLKNALVVAPDVGGVRRARNFAQILNLPLAVVEKKRQTNFRDQAEVLSITGDVLGDTAIIIDDIISTGGTIIEGCQILKQKGVKKIIVCATHGVFAQNAQNVLDKSPVDKILVTDSIEHQNLQTEKIETVTVADLIANCLREEL